MYSLTDAELNGEIARLKASGDRSDAALNRVLRLINGVLPHEKRQQMKTRFAYELGLKVGNTGEETGRNDTDATIQARIDNSLHERIAR